MKTSVLEKDDTMQNTARAIPVDNDNTLNKQTFFTIEMPAKTAEKADVIPKRYAYRFIKRVFDIIVSLFGLIVLSPLFLIIAIAIKLDSKGKVIYSQTRVGKDCIPFKFYKFRSMVQDAEKHLAKLKHLNEMDGPAFKIKDDPRLTKVGKFIRKTSIDELPQLLNVLRGEMSFIGPRPPLPHEVEQYTPTQMQRLDVVGGLSCYWQINGRSEVSFDEWMEMDLQYIKERSLLVDAKIFIKTFAVVFKKTGAH